MSRSELADEELIRLVVAGDTELFEELMLRHRDHVSRIVSGHVPHDLVHEVAHDVFIKAYTGLTSYACAQPFAHWIATIAMRTCYDFWREHARCELPVGALTDDHHRWIEQSLAAQSEAQFNNQARKREAVEILEWALARLSPENRTVLTLVHLDGRSVREAAQLLGWSLINVKVRAYRARQALRKIILSAQGGGPHGA